MEKFISSRNAAEKRNSGNPLFYGVLVTRYMYVLL